MDQVSNPGILGERERESGDKTGWLVFWLRRNRTMNGPPRLLRSGTLRNMVVL